MSIDLTEEEAKLLFLLESTKKALLFQYPKVSRQGIQKELKNLEKSTK